MQGLVGLYFFFFSFLFLILGLKQQKLSLQNVNICVLFQKYQKENIFLITVVSYKSTRWVSQE